MMGLKDTWLAGGWRGIFDGLQGDQEWVAKILKPKRNLAACYEASNGSHILRRLAPEARLHVLRRCECPGL